jgi:hypothetical protein
MALNIFQRINAVRKAIGYVQKDKSVSAGAGGSYKAVTHDAVTGMVRAALIEHGVVIVPSVVSATFHPKEPEAKQRLYEATYQIEFVNMDEPTDRIVTQQNAHALDNGDKAPGKAMSYATKYAILKLFNIETGEDEESRYQRDDFDVIPYLDKLQACKTFDELKNVYQQCLGPVRESGDKEAIQTFTKVKDAEKKRLDAEAKEPS